MLKENSITIRVAKTIQERQYEPFVVEFTMTLESDNGEISNSDIKAAYTRLEQRADAVISARLKALQDTAVYGA